MKLELHLWQSKALKCRRRHRVPTQQSTNAAAVLAEEKTAAPRRTSIPCLYTELFAAAPSQVLMASAVYLLGYFGPEAEPPRACSPLAGGAAVLPRRANGESCE